MHFVLALKFLFYFKIIQTLLLEKSCMDDELKNIAFLFQPLNHWSHNNKHLSFILSAFEIGCGSVAPMILCHGSEKIVHNTALLPPFNSRINLENFVQTKIG